MVHRESSFSASQATPTAAKAGSTARGSVRRRSGFVQVVLRGLSGLVDGEHYFDTFAADAIFESRYQFPGWPREIRGRANLMASLSGYGKTIKPHSGDALVVHRSEDRRVVILEYEVHGKVLSSGAPYDNRLISVVTIEKRKIVHWRDYMDSLAAWTALNG
ncbi:MAG: nuclear transport factor 2 family protein [Terracidiphilus sp.]